MATAPGAFGLKDDAAAFAPPQGTDLVTTCDTIVETVHFLPEDPPGDVARKVLRVNLSDLAAKGAVPIGYLLSLAAPGGLDVAWLEDFAAGLKADQDTYGLSLLGGDTVATPGPMTLTVTALGAVPTGMMVPRNGGKPGDILCVSGTIGDAVLGLSVLNGGLAVDTPQAAFLAQRYRRPWPRTALGPALRGLASAMIDVSDGLLADAGHLAAAGKLALEIELDSVPLSQAARTALETGHGTLMDLCAGGDDYELLCLVPPEQIKAAQRAASKTSCPLAVIGRAVKGEGIRVRFPDGRLQDVAGGGYRHTL